MSDLCPPILKTNQFCTILTENGKYETVSYPCFEPDYDCLGNLESTTEAPSFDYMILLYLAVSLLGTSLIAYFGRLAYIRFVILRSNATIWVLFLASFGLTMRANETRTEDLEGQYLPSAPLDQPE